MPVFHCHANDKYRHSVFVIWVLKIARTIIIIITRRLNAIKQVNKKKLKSTHRLILIQALHKKNTGNQL